MFSDINTRQNGASECPCRCSQKHKQCREARKETGSHQTLLEGSGQVPDGDDEAW